MAILATLPNPNLFTSVPKPISNSNSNPQFKPPIPIPIYPPLIKSQNHPSNITQFPIHPPDYTQLPNHPSEKTQLPNHPLRKTQLPKYPPSKTQENPGLRTHHRNSSYHRPIDARDRVVATDGGGRAVVVGESGVSFLLPGAPFEFQFSYSETPKVRPIAVREPAFLPFAPPSMPRPWTGKAPMKNKVRKERKIRLFDSLDPNAKTLGVREMMLEMGKEYRLGNFGGDVAPRKKVIGNPLTRAEIEELLKPHIKSNRQVNLGRDGLTHNMLELVHTHWKRRPVCKVRCLGVPTVDMDNVCRCLEDKTGGKIIHRVGGVIYIFRGRNYDPRTRPRYPVMLWKPATPVYPKLIQEAPEGLTKAEADKLRDKGKNLLPISKLAKNGVYTSLVKDTRNAFESSILVKLDCKGLDPSDYKRIGAKLKELVPCVLLSFDNEQILMWRGKDWKSMYADTTSASGPVHDIATNVPNSSENRMTDDRKSYPKTVISSPKMMYLWKHAIETNKARLLEDTSVAPDDLLEIVEEFNGLSQASEHSYPALIYKNDSTDDENEDHNEGEYNNNDDDYDDEYYLSDSYGEIGPSAPLGSLPVDFIAKKSSELY